MKRSFDEQVVYGVLIAHQFVYGGRLCRCGRTIPTDDLMVCHQMAAIKVADLEASQQPDSAEV